MRFVKSLLAGLLLASLTLGAAGAPTSIQRSPKAEGAGAERDRVVLLREVVTALPLVQLAQQVARRSLARAVARLSECLQRVL